VVGIDRLAEAIQPYACRASALAYQRTGGGRWSPELNYFVAWHGPCEQDLRVHAGSSSGGRRSSAAWHGLRGSGHTARADLRVVRCIPAGGVDWPPGTGSAVLGTPRGQTFGFMLAHLPVGGTHRPPGTGSVVLSTLRGQTFGSLTILRQASLVARLARAPRYWAHRASRPSGRWLYSGGRRSSAVWHGLCGARHTARADLRVVGYIPAGIAYRSPGTGSVVLNTLRG
jgi:hypothetical protein